MSTRLDRIRDRAARFLVNLVMNTVATESYRHNVGNTIEYGRAYLDRIVLPALDKINQAVKERTDV